MILVQLHKYTYDIHEVQEQNINLLQIIDESGIVF